MGWLTGWTYRKSITLSRASGAVTNYQLKLKVGESSGATGEDVDCNSHALTTFNDLRFTTSDGSTLLSYWIESLTGTTPNQLATVWIEFDSIGTGDTTFYMYYGKAGASAVSSITDTFLGGDDGVTGNFTEAVLGTAAFSHASGDYTLTEDSTDDAASTGYVLSNWNFLSWILVAKPFTGISTAGHVEMFGLFDSSTLAGMIGTVAAVNAKRRFYFARYNSNYSTSPDQFFVAYQNTSAAYQFWTGSAWGGGVTLFSATSVNLQIKVWSDGTNLLCDVYNASGVSYFTSPASIAITSVQAFSSGKCLALADIYSDAYAFTASVDNYFAAQYLSTEPAWGSWGTETLIAKPSFCTVAMSTA